MPPSWSLDPRLASDTEPVGDLALSRLVAMKDARYPWAILVPRRAGATEITDLVDGERVQLMTEIDAVARALKAMTACDKLNIAAIGNLVPQLHIHVVARRVGDPAWPKPVWGHTPATAYAPGALAAFVAGLRRRLGLS